MSSKAVMINKLNTLNSLGLKDGMIEKQAGLGSGTISRIRKKECYRKSTEKKIDKYRHRIIKKIINDDE